VGLSVTKYINTLINLYKKVMYTKSERICTMVDVMLDKSYK